jgi:hypothetical protein
MSQKSSVTQIANLVPWVLTPDRGQIVNKTTLDELQALLLAQLHVFTQSLELLKQRQLISLLRYWKDIEADEAQKWIASQIETDAGTIAIGEASIMYSTVQTLGDHVASHRPSVNRRVLGEIVDIDRLEERLAQIAASPSEKAKQVYDCFRAGLKAPGW